jgi:hypothetical protein
VWRSTDTSLRRQALANGRERLAGVGCSGGFHPQGDLSSGCVFHLRLELREKGTFFRDIIRIFGGFAGGSERVTAGIGSLDESFN